MIESVVTWAENQASWIRPIMIVVIFVAAVKYIFFGKKWLEENSK